MGLYIYIYISYIYINIYIHSYLFVYLLYIYIYTYIEHMNMHDRTCALVFKGHTVIQHLQEAALKEALQSESAGRLRDADENLRRFQELRNLVPWTRH